VKTTKRLEIHGLVQGVYFRGSMYHKAKALGITGWVRNRRNGSVEALIQGSEDAVQKMIAWARHGPESARVEKVDVHEAEDEDEHDRFTQRDTL
jgi:acylphosphatase